MRACYPIAAALSVLNLAGLAYAVAVVEPAHAAVHAVLAFAFGLAAWRRQPDQDRSEGGEEGREAGQEALEDEVSNLRQELIDMQDRLDFTERMLAQ